MIENSITRNLDHAFPFDINTHHWSISHRFGAIRISYGRTLYLQQEVVRFSAFRLKSSASLNGPFYRLPMLRATLVLRARCCIAPFGNIAFHLHRSILKCEKVQILLVQSAGNRPLSLFLVVCNHRRLGLRRNGVDAGHWIAPTSAKSAWFQSSRAFSLPSITATFSLLWGDRHRWRSALLDLSRRSVV